MVIDQCTFAAKRNLVILFRFFISGRWFIVSFSNFVVRFSIASLLNSKLCIFNFSIGTCAFCFRFSCSEFHYFYYFLFFLVLFFFFFLFLFSCFAFQIHFEYFAFWYKMCLLWGYPCGHLTCLFSTLLVLRMFCAQLLLVLLVSICSGSFDFGRFSF